MYLGAKIQLLQYLTLEGVKVENETTISHKVTLLKSRVTGCHTPSPSYICDNKVYDNSYLVTLTPLLIKTPCRHRRRHRRRDGTNRHSIHMSFRWGPGPFFSKSTFLMEVPLQSCDRILGRNCFLEVRSWMLSSPRSLQLASCIHLGRCLSSIVMSWGCEPAV